MKSAFGWLILILLIAGGAGGGLYHFYTTTRVQAYDLELATIKRDFLADTQALHVLEAERYRKEIGPHLNKYYKAVLAQSKLYPELYDIERQRNLFSRIAPVAIAQP